MSVAMVEIAASAEKRKGVDLSIDKTMLNKRKKQKWRD